MCVRVCYASRALGTRGKIKTIPCTVEAIDDALSEVGSGSWHWTLEPITAVQANALGTRKAMRGTVIDLSTLGAVYVEVLP